MFFHLQAGFQKRRTKSQLISQFLQNLIAGQQHVNLDKKDVDQQELFQVKSKFQFPTLILSTLLNKMMKMDTLVLNFAFSAILQNKLYQFNSITLR